MTESSDSQDNTKATTAEKKSTAEEVNEIQKQKDSRSWLQRIRQSIPVIPDIVFYPAWAALNLLACFFVAFFLADAYIELIQNIEFWLDVIQPEVDFLKRLSNFTENLSHNLIVILGGAGGLIIVMLQLSANHRSRLELEKTKDKLSRKNDLIKMKTNYQLEKVRQLTPIFSELQAKVQHLSGYFIMYNASILEEPDFDFTDCLVTTKEEVQNLLFEIMNCCINISRHLHVDPDMYTHSPDLLADFIKDLQIVDRVFRRFHSELDPRKTDLATYLINVKKVYKLANDTRELLDNAKNLHNEVLINLKPWRELDQEIAELSKAK